MNPIAILREEHDEALQALEQHTTKYYWLKGYGTGWQGSHYSISDEEYTAAYERVKELRGRVIALNQEIVRLRRIARPGRGISLLAHRKVA